MLPFYPPAPFLKKPCSGFQTQNKLALWPPHTARVFVLVRLLFNSTVYTGIRYFKTRCILLLLIFVFIALNLLSAAERANLDHLSRDVTSTCLETSREGRTVPPDPLKVRVETRFSPPRKFARIMCVAYFIDYTFIQNNHMGLSHLFFHCISAGMFWIDVAIFVKTNVKNKTKKQLKLWSY